MASDTADVYMRFDGSWGGKPLKGECTDERHPGEFKEGEDKRNRKDGWIQIKKFGFGFGAGDKSEASESKPALPSANEKDQKKRADALEQALLAKTKKDKEAKAKDKTKEEWGKSGPLNFDKFTFSKGADRLSPVLVQMSHAGGYKIPTVEVEAVRYGGTGEDFKIPFLRLIFTNVYIKGCKLNMVAEEGLPSEDIEFEYDSVRMETLWTDNATGERMPGEPIKVGWDLPGQKAI